MHEQLGAKPIGMGPSASTLKGNTRRILLLGNAGTGKTIFRIQAFRFLGIEPDYSLFIQSARHVTWQIFRRTLKFTKGDDFKRADPDRFKDYRILSEANNLETSNLPDFIIESMATIKESAIFRKAFHEIQVNNCLEPMYFVENCQRIMSSDYTPKFEDLLHIYQKGQSIEEATMIVGEVNVKIVELSGTKYARKKWSKSVESFDQLLFFASALDYDDDQKNEEALTFFETVCHSRLFTGAKITLVFTQTDIQLSKLRNDKARFRNIMNITIKRYFEVAERVVPVHEVNLLDAKSVRRLIETL